MYIVVIKVYLDIGVDRKPFGRVEIEIYNDVSIGGQRFLDLAIGKEGVRYQATKFTRLTPVLHTPVFSTANVV